MESELVDLTGLNVSIYLSVIFSSYGLELPVLLRVCISPMA